MSVKKITTPLSDDTVLSLKTGDEVLISGVIYTARDQAHFRLIKLIEENKPLPFDIQGQIIYYVGPTPEKPGEVIGAAGPTTSYRMDKYAPALMKLGLKGMIGKGKRSNEVKEAIQKYRAVYFGAIGGAGALISKSIKSNKVIAYEDLLSEAVRELIVEDFPAIVVNDVYGGDLYEEGRKRYENKYVVND
ncbi:MAG: Fe-S-containing hydro-lyase [Deltaproteobacteria bacterium]|jgi:fumarate hydratase subunit beta|nr:Fe-S-containing hydro-lyase [Deltaproteobacteria bacterium]MCL5892821.1 Fe-S-containing hydro-lyase [Deltaproteobacteria bacterium]